MAYSIGIDIGATKIKGVIAANNGKILIGRRIKTKSGRKRAEILSDIGELIKYLKQEAGLRRLKIEGIGIGVPGVIKKGKLVFGGGTLKQFTGFDFKNFIQKETGLKVFLENDSFCFTLAESYFGAGKKYKRIIGIIWGTGIGAGFIDKKNRSRASVEIGHFIVEPDIKTEPKDVCGSRGCLENLASGKNIVRRYYAKGGKIKNATPKEIYHSKEKAAKKVLEDAYKYFGMVIAVFVAATKIDIVVIGGGVSNLPKPAHDKLKKYAEKYLAEKRVKKPKIVKSKIGEYSGVLGASMLVLKGDLVPACR